MELKKGTITAVIGVFSGRPNPELLLTGEVARELASLVKKTIGREPIHPPPPPKLWCYNGFLVQLPNELAQRFGLPTEFSVHHGVLTEREGHQEKHWRDVAEVERFLIDQAYEQGHGDLIEEFKVGKLELPDQTPNDHTTHDESAI